MKRTKFVSCILLLLAGVCNTYASDIKRYIGLNVDYENYLSKHDVVFQSPMYEGYEGLTIGNGDMGGMVWCTPSGIALQINKSDLYDRGTGETKTTLRSAARLNIDFGIPNFEWLYLNEFQARMSMFDATSYFTCETPFSDTQVDTWVDAHSNVWVIDCNLQTKGQLHEGTSLSARLERWGSRTFNSWYSVYDKDASQGLGKSEASVRDGDIYLTEHLNGLDFVVACRMLGVKNSPKLRNAKQVSLETGLHSKLHVQILVSVVTSDESDNLLEDAVNLLDQKEHETLAKAKQEHDLWWQNFWERSFVSTPEDYIENLYYYRRYLTACSSRGKFPVPFNGGLWTWNHDHRQWGVPHHWNTQEQYWGIAVQNDCDLMLPYINTYLRNQSSAEAYAKERGVENALLWTEAHDFFGTMEYKTRGDMVNNFTPASQIAAIMWEYYQFTCDTEFLEKQGYPFMKKAAEFYVQYLKWDEKKKVYFSFPTQPYEHGNNQLKDSSSDRYMIEALLGWCIESAYELKTDKSKIKQWKHIRSHLWDPPVLDIPGKGRVFGTAYTKDDQPYPSVKNYQPNVYHFDAHTAQVYPANVLGLDDKGTEEFKIATTVSANQPAFRNAITPGSIVSARLGMGDYALQKIKNSVQYLQHFPQGLFYNLDHWCNLSRYADSIQSAALTCQRDYIYDKRVHYNSPKAGRSGLPAAPFIQCGMEPMSIMSTALSEMLIQSHEGEIRVFPAVVEDWCGSFVLGARNAFVVSSEMQDGKVNFIGIESLKGKLCRVQNPWEDASVQVMNLLTSERVPYTLSKQGVIEFKTKEKGKYLITCKLDSSFNPVTYTGIRNNEAKTFGEASLGKQRDF